MTNNAVETVGSEFLWSQADCDRMGIDRGLSFLAWNVLTAKDERTAFAISRPILCISGYLHISSFEEAIVLPQYAAAMRVMATQYLQAVVKPQSIKALQAVQRDRMAAAAARVSAASKLLEYADTSVDRLADTVKIDVNELDIDALAALIDDIEHRRATGAKQVIDVQSGGQMAEAESYLSEFLE